MTPSQSPGFSSDESTEWNAVKVSISMTEMRDKLASNASAENRGCSLDIQITRQDHSIVIINNRVLRKETIRGKTLKQLLPTGASQVMNLATFTLKTTANDIQEPNSVALLEAFPFSTGMKFRHISHAFVTDSDGRLTWSFNCHYVGMAEGC
jgi:hypothetical protein